MNIQIETITLDHGGLEDVVRDVEAVRGLVAENAALRAALGKARPYVASTAEGHTGWALSARKALEIVDTALVATDPDPKVKAILVRAKS